MKLFLSRSILAKDWTWNCSFHVAIKDSLPSLQPAVCCMYTRHYHRSSSSSPASFSSSPSSFSTLGSWTQRGLQWVLQSFQSFPASCCICFSWLLSETALCKRGLTKSLFFIHLWKTKNIPPCLTCVILLHIILMWSLSSHHFCSAAYFVV